MSQPAISASDLAHPSAPAVDVEHGLPPGMGPGLWGVTLAAIAFLFSAFQIFTAVYSILPSEVVRAVHVGFLMLIAFALVANHRSTSTAGRIFGWTLGVISMGVNLYHWVFYVDLIQRAGDLTETDLWVGIVFIALVFYAGYRLLGIALPLVTGLFVAYCLWGHLLPAPFDHRPFDLHQVVDQMAFGTEGIYSTPIAVSATYIYLFILFGAFLERAGMISLFNDVAMGAVGHSRGGPAKVAVISSAFMGMISGSGIANVVTVGQFTIPLMKRFGYKSAFAGGVEATASMGGQIMPPVMGAVAFIMAETLGIQYAEVAKAAIIPALLYFASAFWMVHLEAGRLGLFGLPKDQLPSARKALMRRWPLLLPLAVLVYLLFAGYTPLFAGALSLALTVVIILGMPLSGRVPAGVLRSLFWIALGILCSVFFAKEFTVLGFRVQGVELVLLIVLALIALNLALKGGRDTLLMCRDALIEGARQALPVGIACAVVGMVVGTMTLTGIATVFGNWVVSIGKASIFLSLVLTMITSLVLGMGIPTIPTYIITSSLAAPALLKLGVPLLISHMFVFYFGIIADLTPPVALAAFAAAPIAQASGFSIANQAVRISLAGFVIPYIAVYDHSLMLQADPGMSNSQFLLTVLWAVSETLLAIGLWGVAAIGYFNRALTWPERAWPFVAAVLIVGADPLTEITKRFGLGAGPLLTTGYILAAGFIAYLYARRPKPA